MQNVAYHFESWQCWKKTKKDDDEKQDAENNILYWILWLSNWRNMHRF